MLRYPVMRWEGLTADRAPDRPVDAGLHVVGHLSHHEHLLTEEEAALHHAHLAEFLMVAQGLKTSCLSTSVCAGEQHVGGHHHPGHQGAWTGSIQGAPTKGAGAVRQGGVASAADKMSFLAAWDLSAGPQSWVLLTDRALEQRQVRGEV